MPKSGLRLLVVDDEAITAAAMEQLLEDAGHIVAVASSQGEALAIAGRLSELDAAVVDLQLPDGPGSEIVTALRERWQGLPVVISTGYALDAGDRAAFGPSSGRAVLLKKPWTEQELLAALEKATAALPQEH